MPREPRSFRLHEPPGAQFLRVPGGSICHRRGAGRLHAGTPPRQQRPGLSSNVVCTNALRTRPVELGVVPAAACGCGMPLASVTSGLALYDDVRVGLEYRA